MKVAYLGPKGTFTEKAVINEFPDAELIPIKPIKKVISLIKESKVDRAVVPIENFYNGEVRETLDALDEFEDVKIVGELSMKIIHCIGAISNKEKISKIFSKDQALEQCADYLSLNFPDAEIFSTTSTSEAAIKVSKEKILDGAAIASKEALIQNNLVIISEDICQNNKTRFVILGKNMPMATQNDKTFISFHPSYRDRPGVLSESLSIISKHNVNLEYIQSRPDGKKGYIFYAELLGHNSNENVSNVLKELKFYLDPDNKNKNVVKILGSYKNTNWKD